MIESGPCLSARENGTSTLFLILHFNSSVWDPHWFILQCGSGSGLSLCGSIRIPSTDPDPGEPNQGGSGPETMFNSVELFHEF